MDLRAKAPHSIIVSFRRLLKYFYIVVPISLIAYAGWNPTTVDITDASVITKRYYRYLMLAANLVVLSGVAYAIATFGIQRLLDTAVAKWLIGLAAWIYLMTLYSSTLFGLDVARQNFIQFTWAVIWLSVVVAMQPLIRGRRDLLSAMRVLRVFGLLCGASVYAGLIGYRFGYRIGEIDMESRESFLRYFGPIGDQVGFVLVLFALIALIFRRWPEFGFYIGAIVITGTRGAMLALLVGTAWAVLGNPALMAGKGKQLLVRMFTLVVVTLTILIAVYSTLGSATRERMLSGQDFLEGIYSRTAVFMLAINVFSEHPLAGVGAGGFRHTQSALGEAALAGTKSDENRGFFFTQNQFLQFATDGGLLGAILYVGFVVAVLRLTRKVVFFADPFDKPALVALQAYIIAMLLGNQSAVWFVSEGASGYVLMLSIGIVMAYDRMIKALVETYEEEQAKVRAAEERATILAMAARR